jgi:hypothetical protein
MEAKDPSHRQLYEHMRHPIVLALLLILWCSPTMSADRFLLSFLLTMYTLTCNHVTVEDMEMMDNQLAAGLSGIMRIRPRWEDFRPKNE